MKVIFDFGANVGQNLEYYLQKAEKVIAIEANPELCHEMTKEFETEVAQNRLVIVNAVLAQQEGTTTFWLNRELSVLSQLDEPSDPANFRPVQLPGREMKSIIEDNLNRGEEFLYSKFDLEGYDARALKSLFKSRNFPKHLSAEVQSLDALALLVFQKDYDKFKIVNGSQVAEKYKKAEIKIGENTRTFNFKHHSAGPFGEDLQEKIFSKWDIILEFNQVGTGWRDVHAEKSLRPTSMWRYFTSIYSVLFLMIKFLPLTRTLRLKILMKLYRILGRG
jgi:FkbM family methyltransferase